MEMQNHTQVSGTGSKWIHRGRAFNNILRMGHCAPAVMRTILDITAEDKEWLVRLCAGMPGGIGNTGFECGALTSPLVLLGIRYGLDINDDGLPLIFGKGQALSQEFLGCQCTLNCKEIRGTDRFPRHCIPPVTRSVELFLHALEDDHRLAIPAIQRDCTSNLYSYMDENGFHCARAVLNSLGYESSENRELFDAVSAFTGGTLFMGKTCSAFTAGVMVIGLKTGEIENSYRRVIRLLAIMTTGGNAFDEKINKFNRSMNRGYKLSRWFVREFGSTQCQAMTGCDFSDPQGVRKYIESDCIDHCREVAGMVARKVQSMI